MTAPTPPPATATHILAVTSPDGTFTTYASAHDAHAAAVPGSRLWVALAEPEYLPDTERPGWRAVTWFA